MKEPRFWGRWSGVLTGHPVLVTGVCLAVVVLMGLQALRTPTDLSFTGLLDKSDPEIRAYQDAVRTFGANSSLVCLVEGDAADVAKALALLREVIAAHDVVNAVYTPIAPERIMERAAWLWPEGLFNSVVEEVAAGEMTRGTKGAVDAADAFIRNTVQPHDTAAIITIELDRDPFDMAMGGTNYQAIHGATQAAIEEAGLDVTADFTGFAAIGAQDQHHVLGRVRVLTPVTLVFVLLLLLFVEPRPSRVILAGVALGGSVLVAFGMVGLVQGQLIITVTFFGMLLLGLGIDFGIHMLVALRDGRSTRLSPEESVTEGIIHTGAPIALGGLTSALAFGAVALAPEPSARDMGLAAFFGLTAALLFMLSLLPASWLIFEKRHPHRDAPARLNLPGLRGLVTFSLHHPWIVCGVSLIVTIIGIAGIPKYRIESNLSKIIYRDIPAFDVQERMEELYGISAVTYLAPVDDLETARKWAGELRALPPVGSVASAADFVRSDADARAKAMRKALDASREDGAAEALRARLEQALEAGPYTIENLPPELAMGIVGANGELALRIVPKDNVMDAYVLAEHNRTIRAIAPSATGMPVIGELLIMGRRDYLPYLVPVIFGIVTLMLGIFFRNPRDMALALVPVIVGACAAFGYFFWLGFQFSVLTSLVIPVIIGLGVDNGIHVVARLRMHPTRRDEDIHDAVEGVGRPIFLTTATTCVSFIGLLFTNHPGLESISYFMLLGVPACFLASVTTLPAAAAILGKN